MSYRANMMRFVLLGFILISASCSQPGVTSFTAPKLPPPGGSPDIFKRYQREADSKMASDWTRNMDLSGVSFDSPRTATLVTRRHVVMANHYKRGVGQRVVFHNRSGKRLERTLTAVRPVLGDVAVGLLNSDVPADYTAYPLPAPMSDFTSLIGRTAIITDQNRRLFFHNIAAVRLNSISFQYDKLDRHGWGKKLVVGDSGNPAFVISGRQLVLIETHTSGGPGAGPYYGSPDLQKRLQAVITELSPGYRLRLVRL